MSDQLEKVPSLAHIGTEIANTSEHLFRQAYDHLHKTSTTELAVEGAGLAVAAASLYLFKKLPKGIATSAVKEALTAPEELLTELGLKPLPANASNVGVDLKFKVSADDASRGLTVHLPPNFAPDKPSSVYYLLDGCQFNNPVGDMLRKNGWAKTADAHNFVAVSVEQSEQSKLTAFGWGLPNSIYGKPVPKITSWSSDYGLLNKTAGIDDVQMVESIHARMQRLMAVKLNNVVAYSDGGTVANQLAAKLPEGSLNGVATVASTVLKDSPAIRPGINGFFVNSEFDQVVPTKGGAGPILSKWLPRLGHPHISKSLPELQEINYAAANDLPLTPRVTETPLFVQREYGVSDSDNARVVAFKLKAGGHSWPGLDFAERTKESAKPWFLRMIMGKSGSHSEFSPNEKIVQFFEDGRKIARSLEH